MHTYTGATIPTRKSNGRLSGVCSLLPLCGSQELNSGYQMWQQAPLPSEPYRWPKNSNFWFQVSYTDSHKDGSIFQPEKKNAGVWAKTLSAGHDEVRCLHFSSDHVLSCSGMLSIMKINLGDNSSFWWCCSFSVPKPCPTLSHLILLITPYHKNLQRMNTGFKLTDT